MTTDLDAVDVGLIRLLRERPQTPVVEMARLLGVARGTVQARLRRLAERGVIVGHGPDLDADEVGYGVRAFTTLEIDQESGGTVVDHLRSIPEVLEVHAVTGPGDLLCRIAARSNEHLHAVLQRVLAVGGITRTETHLALNTPLRRSEADLVIAAEADRTAAPD